MRKTLLGMGALAAAALFAGAANAQQGPIKIGLILPYSGQFADAATQMDNAIKLFVKENGDTVAGRKVEFIRKDTGGIAPDVAKRLAQELVVRDGVDILAGFVLTPNAMAAGDVSDQAKKFMVVMNAATSIITTKSPYMVRTSLTTPQLNQALGEWAVKKGGVKKAYTMVSDYGPGLDAGGAFSLGFKEAGGELIGEVKMPVANPDFSAFVQRAKDLNPEGIYIFVPGGAQPGALGKALAERGIDARKTKVMGQLEIADEHAIKAMGDAALGIITASHYDYAHKSAKNDAFVKAYNAAYNRNPDFFSVGGWDGMQLIYDTLKKTGGKTDAQAMVDAAKGSKWESPRGPISIDPETRDIVQTVYIRRVDKVDGKLLNVEIDKVENVKDPVKERMKKK
ncbi:ABC transporter substrate-binding protein [Pseudorhodoplanes sp.]|jgi:branched-chain amino acid transport system substrate-binding protein|uniref:ABC transporter substrate-binding protein n=1 Tax=Pseudorhodoplanes sp. TaxID=1934341 RepID=UPI002CDD16EB|nr:ABC transporter substrate-binding protein [Pseudorhodoplanes sp.]HWV44059.1 ABC transporter substrate-binding protein [Pseudorhodoplanes sp.]